MANETKKPAEAEQEKQMSASHAEKIIAHYANLPINGTPEDLKEARKVLGITK